MTPELMQAGAAARARAAARSAADGFAGGRTVSYGRRVEPGVLDLAHGRILYLEDITVSFDGFRALNKLSLDIAAGSTRRP